MRHQLVSLMLCLYPLQNFIGQVLIPLKVEDDNFAVLPGQRHFRLQLLLPRRVLIRRIPGSFLMRLVENLDSWLLVELLVDTSA